MRAVVLVLVLALPGPGARTVRAADPPAGPPFWASEEEMLEEAGAGQFNDRLELHLLQYAADASWRAGWAARKYSESGLFGEYGSTRASELYVNGAIALNIFPSERIQLRYDRREYRDGRFDVSDERFDVLWHTGAGLAVVLTGWPSFEKAEASFGLGIRLGAARARDALELRVVNDRFLWNEKSSSDVTITKRPIRVVLDGSLERGPWRVHGTADWGLGHAAEAGGEGGAPARSARGFQRFVDVSAERALGSGAIGVRVTGAALERRQEEGSGAVLRLERRWGRAVLTGWRGVGRVTLHGLLGVAAQRDEVESPSVPSGSYRMDALLVGLEGGVPAARGLEVRLGYLGCSQRSERTAEPAGPLPSLEESPFLDKAHVKALYVFRPGMSIELLLSQALRGGSFGGGSLKALLAF